MRGSASLGFIGSVVTFMFILASIALSIPLIVFATEAYSNPNLLQVQASLEQINETHARLNATIYYSGSVPLKDFSVKIGDKWYNLGTIKNGETRISIIVETGSLVAKEYSFSIGGLYPVKLEVEKVG
ncbi:MAG: hypothetical protein F7C38_04930 [Desulfurococcales archaeon]|nr:hypothetical protein [Desulfurococcales archaeon]